VPTALCFGSSDSFLDLSAMFDFLESKRTNMKALTFSGKVRACRAGGRRLWT
jgi:hypothetical protein